MTFILNTLSLQSSDPILGLASSFKKDERLKKIDLTAGVYSGTLGTATNFKSIHQAEEILLKSNTPKTYLPILGSLLYTEGLQKLVFNHNHSNYVSAYAPGGTGALRMAMDLLARDNKNTTIWVSNPTWANHLGIIRSAGLTVQQYAYKHTDGTLKVDDMLKGLENAKPNDLVLLHACCHNPTGTDPDSNQWNAIFDYLKGHDLIPFFDMAYHGFAKNQTEDAWAVREADKRFETMLVSYSFSKIMGLYAERVGGLLIKCLNTDQKKTLESHLAQIARTNYSNPPMHGLMIAAYTMTQLVLCELWQVELAYAQKRVAKIRYVLAEKMRAKHLPTNGIDKQHGLFSFFAITAQQAQLLRKDYGIYVLDSGRINVAGLTDDNIDLVLEALEKVLKQ